MKFKTILLLSGNNTGVLVPPEVVEALGAGKKPAVNVTIDGSYSYRSTIASMGGKFLISFSAEHRAKSGLKGGEAITVELMLDTAPRVVEVPPELAAALGKDKVAKAVWDKLSYSQQRQHQLAIDGAKAADTRARRVTKTIETLKAD
jgi:hypothetical protein